MSAVRSPRQGHFPSAQRVFEFEGTRGGKTWSVVIERIPVTGQSAVGFEFRVDSPIRRAPSRAKERTEVAAG
ncbi:MAG: hypothetical protein JSU68_04530 [Phycisphaerales bacterium]|nr:MAG: hypothetical protein JSU68_04530 [Phycisphaerales bacterium]